MTSSNSIIIQSPQIRITDSSLYSSIMANDLESIKKYCDQGKNKAQLQEIMTLGINPTHLHIDDKGKTALLIAAKNKYYEMLNFIISNAIEDENCKKLLAHQLLIKINTGRNILHEAASVPENRLIIDSLCQAAKHLALENYVNSSDDMYGSTALHLAASRSSYENYAALIKNGGDEKIISTNGLRAIDVCSKDYARSKTFMFSYLNNEGIPETIHLTGINDFKKHHDTPPKNLSPQFLEILIEIDLDILVKNNGRAQAMASYKTMEILIKIINGNTIQDDELNALLGNFSRLNFAVIHENDIERNKISMILLEAVNKACIIEDKTAKNHFIRAEILRRIKPVNPNHQITISFNKEAFDCYTHGSLMNHCPQLALYGIQQTDITHISPVLVKRRVAAALANIELNAIPEKKYFFNNTSSLAKGKITEFLGTLQNCLEQKELNNLIINFSTDKDKNLIIFQQKLFDTLDALNLLTKEVLEENKLQFGKT